MRLSLNSASVVLLGIVGSTSLAEQAQAGDARDAQIVHAADRCADYGLGFLDLGRGNCGRTHVRVDGGLRNANSNFWTSSGTSSAALRSDGLGMLPGAGDLSHLRVRNNLESYSPFR